MPFSLYAIRIKHSAASHPVWKPGIFLCERGVEEGDFGPGNCQRFCAAAFAADAAFYHSDAAAKAAIKKLWWYSDGKELEIVKWTLQS